MKRWVGLMVAGALVLGGCASSNAPPTFDLTAPRDFGARSGVPRGQLLVVEPKAIASLDTERIAARQDNGSVAYLTDGAWGDRLPRLLQARMVQAFENANRLKSVGRPGDRLASDWQLLTDVRAFELTSRAGEVMIEVSVKLVNDRTGRIVAAEVFGARANAPGTEAGLVSRAFNAALDKVLRDIVDWTTRRV